MYKYILLVITIYMYDYNQIKYNLKNNKLSIKPYNFIIYYYTIKYF